jgi:A/G-specific adenine glycosylase
MATPSDFSAAEFIDDLLGWYDYAAADLPFRRSRDPYFIWLSEIMLQQTQITTVLPYFDRFTKAFPTVAELAAAPLDQVLKLCERVAVLDGNVVRVLTRLFDIADDIKQTATQRRLWSLAESLVPADRSGDYNQAMMELGRTICRPRQPLCLVCPVSRHCTAFKRGVQNQRPVKAPKPQTPHYDVAAGVIWNDQNQVLIAQRPAEGLLGGLWEFPGGKQEAGETLPECLRRELREELAIEVEVGDLLCSIKHAFTHFKITLHAFDCRYLDGPPQAIQCADWRWVTLDQLDAFAFGKTDRRVIEWLRSNPR